MALPTDGTVMDAISALLEESDVGEALAALLYAAADELRGQPAQQWRQVWFAKSEFRTPPEKAGLPACLWAEVLWHEDEGIAKLVIEVLPDYANWPSVFAFVGQNVLKLIPMPSLIRAQVCPTYVHAIEWGQKTYRTQVARFRQLTVLEPEK